MSNTIINRLPDELYVKIYKYINPISKPYTLDKRYWCCNCGEYIDEYAVFIEMSLYCFECFNLKNNTLI